MSYFLAPSLVLLRNEVNNRWPNRSKASDGWIGDAAHSARRSDHNPDWKAKGSRRGIVRALDITTTSLSKAEKNLLLKHTTNDARISYVIHAGRIYTHTKGWYKYNGPNPHNTHVHVSIRHNSTSENSKVAWFGSANSSPTAKAAPKKAASTAAPKAAKAKKTAAKAAPKHVRDEASIRRICIRATSGTEKNSTGHLVGLYQRAQLKPHELVQDQHWGNKTDGHYRWVHKLQVEMNRWKGSKVNENGTFNAATKGRIKQLQERNHGNAYKGKIDGVAGPVFCAMLGVPTYPN